MKVACKPDQGKSSLARLTKASQQQAVSSDDRWSEARRKESPCKHGVPLRIDAPGSCRHQDGSGRSQCRAHCRTRLRGQWLASRTRPMTIASAPDGFANVVSRYRLT